MSEIINTATLEGRMQMKKKYLTRNKKIRTKAYSKNSSPTSPYPSHPVLLQFIRKPVCRSAKQIIRLAPTGITRGQE